MRNEHPEIHHKSTNFENDLFPLSCFRDCLVFGFFCFIVVCCFFWFFCLLLTSYCLLYSVSCLLTSVFLVF